MTKRLKNQTSLKEKNKFKNKNLQNNETQTVERVITLCIPSVL